MFFVTGNGRSGTVFLSDLLTKSENGWVFHEYPSLDRRGSIDAYLGQKELVPERLNLIEARVKQYPKKIYGEVNSYLRYQVPFLRTLTPQIFHLVRNGKDVIRSMVNRNLQSFTEYDTKGTKRIFPYGNDSWIERWSDMNRFERLCWFWQQSILKMCKEEVPVIQLEQILISYEYLQEKLLSLIGIELDFDIWNYERRILKNKTPKISKEFSGYAEWSKEQKNSFSLICREAMDLIGYEI